MLFIYNGSVRGKLSGGEYVYGIIRRMLKDNFEVRELILDDLLPPAPPRVHRLMKRFGLAALVFVSFFLYNRYDLVVTTWTPEVPFCGDITYVQSYSGLFEEPRERVRILETFGKKILALPMLLLGRSSIKRQTFVAVSAFCQQHIDRKFKKRSRVIYPPAQVKLELSLGDRENFVLSMGRISPEKNFDSLAIVGPRVREAKFLLVGPVASVNQAIVKEIQESFANQNLQQNFEYMGWISEKEKERLQNTAKVLFHPAKNDPFPLVIIEALNHGIIPVIDNSGGAPELLPYVHVYDSIGEATAKIREALSQWTPSLATTLHNESMRFTVNHFKEELTTVLFEIAERNSRTGWSKQE